MSRTPGASAADSAPADWAVMMILAREDQTYARLRFGIGPAAEIRVPVHIDYARGPATGHPGGAQ